MLLALSILVFGRNLRPTVLLFLGLYVLYGIFIRKYYLLVVGAWTVLYFVFLKPRRYAWIAAIAAVVIALAMPDGTAELLQSPRDTSNAYANIVGSDNRTAFTNLVPPTNGLNFLLNYGYAASVLVFPFFYFGALSVSPLSCSSLSCSGQSSRYIGQLERRAQTIPLRSWQR